MTTSFLYYFWLKFESSFFSSKEAIVRPNIYPFIPYANFRRWILTVFTNLGIFLQGRDFLSLPSKIRHLLCKGKSIATGFQLKIHLRLTPFLAWLIENRLSADFCWIFDWSAWSMTSNGNHIRYSLDSVESQRRDVKIPPIRVDSRRIISSHNSLTCLQHQDSKYFNLNAKAQKPKEIAKVSMNFFLKLFYFVFPGLISTLFIEAHELRENNYH